MGTYLLSTGRNTAEPTELKSDVSSGWGMEQRFQKPPAGGSHDAEHPMLTCGAPPLLATATQMLERSFDITHRPNRDPKSYAGQL